MPPGYKNFSKELLACFLVDRLDDYFARKNKIHDEGVKQILEEQERIRKEKGYAEHGITDEKDEAATLSFGAGTEEGSTRDHEEEAY
jgi:hydrogenase maturation factor HypF (carbamoyltransferase family)